MQTKPWLVATVLLGVTTAARADSLIASGDGKGALFIDRVSDRKLDKVYDEAGKHVVSYAWSDGKTLWVIRGAAGAFTVGSIVDGISITGSTTARTRSSRRRPRTSWSIARPRIGRRCPVELARASPWRRSGSCAQARLRVR